MAPVRSTFSLSIGKFLDGFRSSDVTGKGAITGRPVNDQPLFVATGGHTSWSDRSGWVVHKFDPTYAPTSNTVGIGTTIGLWVRQGEAEVDILVCGGGGGGGGKNNRGPGDRRGGGGGGGGGVVQLQQKTLSPGWYPITIGAPGNKGFYEYCDGPRNGTSGEPSVFTHPDGPYEGGGGSGGGYADGPSSGGSSGSPQSESGGGSSRSGGGGGGAGGAGQNGPAPNGNGLQGGGAGGAGITSSITGSNVDYGQGGSGGQQCKNCGIGWPETPRTGGDTAPTSNNGFVIIAYPQDIAFIPEAES